MSAVLTTPRTFRDATLADLPRLCELFERFRVSSPYAQYGPPNPAVSTALLERLIAADDGVILVTEHDGVVMGLIGLLVSPHPMSGERVATELLWWLEPEHRGAGAWLLRRAERWAQAQHAVRMLVVSPQSPDVDCLYQTLGYAPMETAWHKSLDWFSQHQPRATPRRFHGIRVHDDVLPDPLAYRAMALQQRFQAVQDGPVVFQRMAPCANPALMLWIVQRYPQLTPTLTFFRQGARDQPEPHYVHTDASMGEWTGILYLTPHPPEGDGTAFWRSKDTGWIKGLQVEHDAAHWFDATKWDRWHLVEAKFNRLVLFQARLYHSRAIRENYGHGDDARLTQNTFGTGAL